ncbi:CYTH domain-containing protein, partial [bacterium]|nr:CYTH domain-containing protein [bacterium]
MNIEIEKKFLVKNDSFKNESVREIRIMQRYLASVPERSVRIRIAGEKGFITIKGIANDSGISRFEWEKEISVVDANELFTICEPGVIDKMRYIVKKRQHTFEIDVFYGENEGLIIAEIELSSEEETFIIPDWLGEEITGNVKYYNSMLRKNPFSKWK